MYKTETKEYEDSIAEISELKKNEDLIPVEYYLDLKNTTLTRYLLEKIDGIYAYNKTILIKRYGL